MIDFDFPLEFGLISNILSKKNKDFNPKNKKRALKVLFQLNKLYLNEQSAGKSISSSFKSTKTPESQDVPAASEQT